MALSSSSIVRYRPKRREDNSSMWERCACSSPTVEGHVNGPLTGCCDLELVRLTITGTCIIEVAHLLCDGDISLKYDKLLLLL